MLFAVHQYLLPHCRSGGETLDLQFEIAEPPSNELAEEEFTPEVGSLIPIFSK